MSDYPWTPGPWSADDSDWLCANVRGADGQEVCTSFCRAPLDCRHDHDAELIALAPEMAEAILLLVGGSTEPRAHELAARIQAIIAEHGGYQ